MQINQNLTPFEATVLQHLVELNTKMDDIVGTKADKNSGRIPVLEAKVSKLTIGLIVSVVLGAAAAGPHALTIVTWLLK